IPISDVRAITKLLPLDLGATLEMAKTGKNKKGAPLEGYNPGPLNELIESRQNYRDLWNYSEKLENLSRQTGVHAAAVIIAPVAMSDLAPLFRARKEDTPVIMYDKHYAEDIGLLKMDFLGLRNLSIIQDAVALIKQTRNVDLEIGRIPLDDAKTFDLLSKGLTVGVFQFESPGMREYLRKLIPERIEDLIAMNALYRPGPIEQIPHYIARKRGEEPVDCYHEDLEPILSETYGVIVYQEQVMRIAQKLGGYSLGGADIIRRIMAKKKPEEMTKLEPEFMNKCLERGYKASLVKEIWKVLLPFCGYAFNKSHAAAYAYVAYQTAYLKANYGPEFMAASMTSEISKTENIVSLLKECSKMDIPYLGPNINSSFATFSVDEQGRILYGLAGIKNVGISIVEDIVEERTLHGEYKDIFDLCKRLLNYQASLNEKKSPLSKKVLESLVMSGALDEFPGSRSALLATIDKAIEVANRYRQNIDCGQVSIFDLGDNDTCIHTAEELEDAEEWTYIELLNKEKDVLGMFISGHPLEEYRPELQGFTTCSLAESEINNSGLLKKSITIGGVITKMRSFETRRGDTLGSGIIQDFQGEIALFLTSDKWEAFRDRVSIDDRVLVQGVLEMQRDDKGLQVVVEKIVPLETVRQKWVKFLHVSFSSLAITEETLSLLNEKLKSYEPFPGESSCQLIFHIESLSGYEHALVAKKIRFKYEQELLVWLKKDFGVTDVWVSNKNRS
ncbi:MAG TPA: DNA polymerase III subunit alpha, partial [Fibrobacteraceae bacterium]|nr:DNA polymerase III subunit alpha [Fibrobacteraceae bacterium]